MIDNSIWKGKVIEKEIADDDTETKGIIEVVRKAMNDERVNTHTLMIADGLTIV